jgi:hypothetical protein
MFLSNDSSVKAEWKKEVVSGLDGKRFKSFLYESVWWTIERWNTLRTSKGENLLV